MKTNQDQAIVWSPLGLLSVADRMQVLRFAASFVWADLEVVDAERRFLADLARELHVVNAPCAVAGLLARPPGPEDVDPAAVHPAIADIVRHTALRAIAADGRVDPREMEMFELLDDLLPKGPKRSTAGVGPPRRALVA